MSTFRGTARKILTRTKTKMKVGNNLEEGDPPQRKRAQDLKIPSRHNQPSKESMQKQDTVEW